MKRIKGAYEAIKLRYLLFVFAAVALIALPLRVYQLLALVDPATGFYTESNGTVYLLSALLVLAVGAFISLSFISKEVPSPRLPEGKNIILGISSIVMAVAFGVDILSIERTIVPSLQNSTQIFFSVLKSNLAEAGGAFVILQFIFAFLSLMYFAIFAVSHLNGKSAYKEYKILALSPLCWAITRLVSKLMSAISFLSVSELLFEIFMLVFLMLFFLTFARITSGIFTEDSMWGIYGYGLSAAVFASLVTIPRLVMLIVGGETVEGNGFNFADLACLVFVVSYIFASLGIGFKESFVDDYNYNYSYDVDENNDEEEIIATNAGIPRRRTEEDDALPIITSRTLASVKNEAVVETESENADVTDYDSDNSGVVNENEVEATQDIYSYTTPEEEDVSAFEEFPSVEEKQYQDVYSHTEIPTATENEVKPEIQTPVATGTEELPEAPVKRGRGRPRKNPLPETTANSASSSTKEEKPVEDMPAEPVKRDRGRPRKNPLPEVAETTAVVSENAPETAESAEQPVKRGRGRPKKVLTPEQIAEMEAIAAQKQAEKERKAEERRLAEEEKQRERERKAEERRLAQEAKLAEAARIAEEKRLAKEAKLAEAARIAEEKRLAEEARKAEEARIAEEARKLEEARKAEEARRLEEARRAEELRRAEEEKKRLEEERIRAEEERRAEMIRKAEEARRIEAERVAEEARRLEEARRAEEARKAEEARIFEEARRREALKVAEEKRRLEEARRAEEMRKAEEARRAEELRRAEEARLAEEAKRKVEEAKRKAEEARLAEETRKAEMMRKADSARMIAKAEPSIPETQPKKPGPPPMVSSKKAEKTVSDRVSAVSAPTEKKRTSERIEYKSSDGEYEIYEEYIPLEGKDNDVEVAPPDFGRLTYADFFVESTEDTDDFVFNDFEEEKKDDGEFNYGVKVIKKKRISTDIPVGSKAPVQAIVLTDDSAPADYSTIDGKKMVSLADMRKNQNKKNF